MTQFAYAAAEKIKQIAPGFQPKLAIVLGSGLGGFAENLTDTVTISYTDLPGFPEVTVKGHGGELVLGFLNGVAVACLKGRTHSYEGNTHEIVKTYVRTLKLLGCDYFIATNAAGSLQLDAGPGELMLITDHINFQPTNPLIGLNDDDFGPRFLPLDNAYNEDIRNKLLSIAEQLDFPLYQGVYIAVSGPNYETAAEIRAFKILGADAVGMSTVPEVLIAHHCGMKVGVISIITNYATGLTTVSHNHEDVIAKAAHAAKRLVQLINVFISELDA